MSHMMGQDLEKGYRVMSNYPWWHPALSDKKGEVVSAGRLRGWNCNNPEFDPKKDYAPCDCGFCLSSATMVCMYLTEVGAELPARFFMMVDRGFLRRISQVRHSGIKLVWDAQRERQVDSYLTGLTSVVWHARAWLDGMWVTAKAFDPEEYQVVTKEGEGPKVYGRKLVVGRRSLWESYDSYEDHVTLAEQSAIGEGRWSVPEERKLRASIPWQKK